MLVAVYVGIIRMSLWKTHLVLCVLFAMVWVSPAYMVAPATFESRGFFKAAVVAEDDFFGRQVALDGDTLVIASEGHASGVVGDPIDFSADDAGAVYVFTRPQGAWQLQAYLQPADPDQNDFFGHSVAISGDTIAVGAYAEDSSSPDPFDNTLTASGAVYVFTRSGNIWSQQAFLKAANLEAADRFGSSVALSGDTLVVGAEGEDSGDPTNASDNTQDSAGAAYIFTRSQASWTQQAYIKAAMPLAGSLFGTSVAISGDTVAVGAPYEVVPGTFDIGAGAVYIFTCSSNIWSQQALLRAIDPASGDHFGLALALVNDTVVVGTPGDDSATLDPQDNSLVDSGAVYVFSRSGSTWNQTGFLKALDRSVVAYFGTSVSLSGSRVAVGVPNVDDYTGAAYIFEDQMNQWNQITMLHAFNADPNDQFGVSVALDGNFLLVGADAESSRDIADPTNNTVFRSGAAYTFFDFQPTHSVLLPIIRH